MDNLLPQPLCAEIERRYRLEDIRSIQALAGGEWNRVVQVETGGGLFVVRVGHPTTTPERATYAHALMRFLKGHVPQVCIPVAADDGSTFFLHEARMISVYPFVSGRLADSRSESDRRSAACILARLHRAAGEFALNHPPSHYPPLREIDNSPNPMWNNPALRSFLTGDDTALKHLAMPVQTELHEFINRLSEAGIVLAQEIELARGWITGLRQRPLHFAPIHGDYYPGNLLMQERGINAILDWDDCRPEWLVYELGRAIWEFCQHEEEPCLREDRAVCFLQTYAEAGGPVADGEYGLLLPFMQFTRLEDTLFDLAEAFRGGSWDRGYSDYHLHNLTAMRRLESLKGRFP